MGKGGKDEEEEEVKSRRRIRRVLYLVIASRPRAPSGHRAAVRQRTGRGMEQERPRDSATNDEDVSFVTAGDR